MQRSSRIYFWSLSVEEHFYLFFPMFLLLRVRRRAVILGGIAVLLAVWNSIVPNTPALEFRPVLAWRTDVALNEILIPALIAILIAAPKIWQSLVRLIHPWSALLAAGALCFGENALPALSAAAGILVYRLLLLGTMLHPEAWFTRFLELPPMRFIGKFRLAYIFGSNCRSLGRTRERSHWELLCREADDPAWASLGAAGVSGEIRCWNGGINGIFCELVHIRRNTKSIPHVSLA